MPDEPPILTRLTAVIADRKTALPPRSYTVELLQGGVDKIGAKIAEEAAEVVAAARASDNPGRAHLVHETADLVYHLLVLLGYRDVPWDDVEAELARRFGVSGLDEKASRTSARPS